jgi:acetyl esterase/lipase
MAPESGLSDMIMDVKRALAWMKENAKNYGVDPDRIILGGASSGAYLALMASYTAGTAFVPEELRGRDFSCLGVVTESPNSDLKAFYYHTNQQNINHSKSAQTGRKEYQKILSWLGKKFSKEYHRLRFDKGYPGIGDITPLLGGSPEECPENYKIYSPATYVHSGCSPTLLIHGDHDSMAPVHATQALYDELVKVRVPVVMNILAQTDHAFNRFLPDISPAAITVIYDIERFIAIAANRKAV